MLLGLSAFWAILGVLDGVRGDVLLLAVGIASVLYGSDAEQRRTWWDGLAGTVVILDDAVPLVVRPAGR